MSRTVVISQPMFLPWIGLFEQVRLADIFYHYDDVQLPQGRSFTSRVQIKTAQGVDWLTVPIDRRRSGRLINEVVLASHEDWRSRHLRLIRTAYARAPHFELMFNLVESLYGFETESLADFDIHCLEVISGWLGFKPEFRRSSTSGIGGSSTQRLLDLCLAAGADNYVTGLGALNYLKHESFEERGVAVRYMDYQRTPYPQQHGEFTPFVSIIDAIANVGERTGELVASSTVDWRTLAKPTADAA